MQNSAYSIWKLQLTQYLEKDMGCKFRFLLLYKLQYASAAYTNNSTALSKQSCSCSIFNFATLYHLLYSGVYINNTFQIFIEDEKYNILQHHFSAGSSTQSSSFNSVFTSIESQKWSHPKITSSRPWWTQDAAPCSWIQVWGSSLHVQSSQLQLFHHQSLWWGRVFKALTQL